MPHCCRLFKNKKKASHQSLPTENKSQGPSSMTMKDVARNFTTKEHGLPICCAGGAGAGIGGAAASVLFKTALLPSDLLFCAGALGGGTIAALCACGCVTYCICEDKKNTHRPGS